jgi:hypothetical protein
MAKACKEVLEQIGSTLGSKNNKRVEGQPVPGMQLVCPNCDARPGWPDDDG